MQRLVSLHGAPLFMRSDKGYGFLCMAILEWIASAGFASALNDPGKPWQNGTDESFDGTFRAAGLSVEWFGSRREASIVIDDLASPRPRGPSTQPSAILDPTGLKRPLCHDLQPAIFQECLSRQNSECCASTCPRAPICPCSLRTTVKPSLTAWSAFRAPRTAGTPLQLFAQAFGKISPIPLCRSMKQPCDVSQI